MPTSSGHNNRRRLFQQQQQQQQQQLQQFHLYQQQQAFQVPTSVVDPDDHDRLSVRSSLSTHSTVATTASLASRLAFLNIEFGDKAVYEASILEGSESAGGFEEQEDPDGSIIAEPITRTIVRQGAEAESPRHRVPPFQICSRIFSHKVAQPVLLKRLTAQHCEELKNYGYTIVDGLVSKELSAQIKAAALNLYRKGRMEEGARAAACAGVPPDMCQPERVTRGDHALWLTVGRPPADTWPLSALLVVLQEVYEDLVQFVKLRRSGGEYQVTLQPGGAQGTSRHRDALPDAAPLQYGASDTRQGEQGGSRLQSAISGPAGGWSAGSGAVMSNGGGGGAGDSSGATAAAVAAQGGGVLVGSSADGGAQGQAQQPAVGGSLSSSGAHIPLGGQAPGSTSSLTSSTPAGAARVNGGSGRVSGEWVVSEGGAGGSSSGQLCTVQQDARLQSPGPSYRRNSTGMHAANLGHPDSSGARQLTGSTPPQPPSAVGVDDVGQAGCSGPLSGVGGGLSGPVLQGLGGAVGASGAGGGGVGGGGGVLGRLGGLQVTESGSNTPLSLDRHSQQQQQQQSGIGIGPRRITCIVTCNTDWERDQGGVVRIWPPRARVPGQRPLRRSLTGSEAGMSQMSEDRSDTFSLRSQYLATFGAAASVTSSMWAEVGFQEAETASVDGSLVDPSDAKEDRPGVDWLEVDGEQVLDVAPLGGRIILLLSGALEHAISQSTHDMATVTAWY